ncbi:Fic family protein [Actinomyces bowdenii]|uniref:Fic/DOC family protein n=1 Tax=Actinomyces bowdenii TaxID=131109 RepID=UPI001ABD1B17|nr:Fic family protein [Actinomyces bowdenii]MBO3724195.1 Fic family protein [Actinomyces bowdenii]
MAVYDLVRDPYLDPASGVLRNRLDISDPQVLAETEEVLVATAAFSLLESLKPDHWDAALLKHLHHELFGRLYTWAGQYRTVEISKGSSRFAMAQYIPSQTEVVFSNLEQERHDWQPGDPAVIDRLAHYYSELNAIHPFREGNGRTIRLLLSLLSNRYGWWLDWAAITAEENTRASTLAFHGDESELREVLQRVAGRIQASESIRKDDGGSYEWTREAGNQATTSPGKGHRRKSRQW